VGYLFAVHIVAANANLSNVLVGSRVPRRHAAGFRFGVPEYAPSYVYISSVSATEARGVVAMPRDAIPTSGRTADRAIGAADEFASGRVAGRSA
jgi:hypothetical protein